MRTNMLLGLILTDKTNVMRVVLRNETLTRTTMFVSHRDIEKFEQNKENFMSRFLTKKNAMFFF